MKLRNTLGILGLFILLAFATGAQDQPIKIGVVDVEQAISSTEDGKAAREELTRKQREAEAQVTPLMERYKALEDEINSRKFVLSDDALFQKKLDLAEIRNQIDNKVKEIEGQLKVDSYRIQEPLVTKMRDLINKVGRDGGYTMILQQNAPGIIYSREALDITEVIISEYNKGN